MWVEVGKCQGVVEYSRSFALHVRCKEVFYIVAFQGQW